MYQVLVMIFSSSCMMVCKPKATKLIVNSQTSPVTTCCTKTLSTTTFLVVFSNILVIQLQSVKSSPVMTLQRAVCCSGHPTPPWWLWAPHMSLCIMYPFQLTSVTLRWWEVRQHKICAQKLTWTWSPAESHCIWRITHNSSRWTWLQNLCPGRTHLSSSAEKVCSLCHSDDISAVWVPKQ